MNDRAAIQAPSETPSRLLEWTKIILVVLFAGPPIGGIVYAPIAVMVSKNALQWDELPLIVLTSMAASYVVGLPIAVIAIILFLSLHRFISRRTEYLAVICGLLASLIFSLLYRASVPLAFGFGGFVMLLLMFGIPSAVSAFVCWRITQKLHRLQ